MPKSSTARSSKPRARAEAFAAEASTAAAPAATADEAIPEPEVVITTRGEDRHEEYRISGRLYMIKVIPKRGAPYYLVDEDGQGRFIRSDLLPSTSPPMWVIKRF